MADSTSIISNAAVRGAYRSRQALTAAPARGRRGRRAPRPSFADMVGERRRDAVQTVRAGRRHDRRRGCGARSARSRWSRRRWRWNSTVKVAVAVRDKLVEAYQEIMRMPI